MTSFPGCRAYQGTRSDLTGQWLACEMCGHPQAAHSPEARLLPESPGPDLEATVLAVLAAHRICWEPGSWYCACGRRRWTNDEHWNEHHATLIAGALRHYGLAPALSDPDAARPGIPGPRSTSAAAALRVAPRTGTQRRAILDYVAAHELCTDAHIQAALGMDGNTERPRRGELVEGGWLEEADRRGRTLAGEQAIRWRLTVAARVQLQGAA